MPGKRRPHCKGKIRYSASEARQVADDMNRRRRFKQNTANDQGHTTSYRCPECDGSHVAHALPKIRRTRRARAALLAAAVTESLLHG